MPYLSSNFRRHILTVVIGASLTLAFAPFNISLLAIICPALLLILWKNLSPKQAFLTGALFGLGFFGTGLSWVYISLHNYGQASSWLAGLLTFLMIAVLVMYIAIPGYLLNRFFPNATVARYLLAFPSLWILGEWCRGWVFTGFPWLFLGYSQLETSLAGWAPIMGVFGVSWLVALLAGSLAWVLLKTKERLLNSPLYMAAKFSTKLKTIAKLAPADQSSAILEALFQNKNSVMPFKKITASAPAAFLNIKTLFFLLLLIWLTGFTLHKINWTQADGEPIQVSLIQGNVPQTLKWTPDQAEKSLAIYDELTQQHWDSPLIIWPEAAVTYFQAQAEDYLDNLSKMAKAHHSTIITGIPMREDEQSYNGMMAIGNGSGSYQKRHLVPFGEYMPLRFLLKWLDDYVQIPMSDYSSGKRQQPLLQANGISIASSICYEIAYPTEVLDNLPEGKLLLTISDDSWFGKSIASHQHLQIAQMRALETGRYLLMSTNDGATAIVNPKGAIQAIAPLYTKTVLTGKIQPMSGYTPWMHIGIYPIMLMMVLLLWLARRKQN
jgi:apolipoprotein N-acyltransferase